MAEVEFLLTRPLRDVTYLTGISQYTVYISTHTPLAGRDYLTLSGTDNFLDFYSHAPCGT